MQARLAEEAVDVAALEADVYEHLYRFFRRYYSDGDFLSRRVYKPGVYAIPYEGEEVKRHWANADQYYIKTSEYLRDYTFRLQPQNPANPMRVHFRLVDAAEGEHGSVKAAGGKERVFVLASGDFIHEENAELVIGFHYRPATLADWPPTAGRDKAKPPCQKELLALAEKQILDPAAHRAADTKRWLPALAQPHYQGRWPAGRLHAAACPPGPLQRAPHL